MDSATLLQLLSTTFILVAKLLAPILGTALGVGLTVNLFQAVTQLNDSTVSFLPKLVAVCASLWLCWPWMMQTMVDYTQQIFLMSEHISR